MLAFPHRLRMVCFCCRACCIHSQYLHPPAFPHSCTHLHKHVSPHAHIFKCVHLHMHALISACMQAFPTCMHASPHLQMLHLHMQATPHACTAACVHSFTTRMPGSPHVRISTCTHLHMCAPPHVRIFTCTRLQMCTSSHASIPPCAHPLMHATPHARISTWTHLRMHVYACVLVHAFHMHARISNMHACTHIHVHTYLNACIAIPMCMHASSHTCIFTYTHLYMRASPHSSRSLVGSCSCLGPCRCRAARPLPHQLFRLVLRGRTWCCCFG